MYFVVLVSSRGRMSNLSRVGFVTMHASRQSLSSKPLVLAGITHGSAPKVQNTALIHLLAKIFHRVRLEEPKAGWAMRLVIRLPFNHGRSRSKLIVIVTQSLLQNQEGKRFMQDTGSLTCTMFTHASTPSFDPSTYMIPGGPWLFNNTKTACLPAACLSLATFLRLVICCVRIRAFHVAATFPRLIRRIKISNIIAL